MDHPELQRTAALLDHHMQAEREDPSEKDTPWNSDACEEMGRLERSRKSTASGDGRRNVQALHDAVDVGVDVDGGDEVFDVEYALEARAEHLVGDGRGAGVDAGFED